MKEPRWLGRELVLALHGRLLAEHGGQAGLREAGLLDSALAAPRQIWNYAEEVELADLAAAYTHALLRNHPFVDGNKRIALVSAGLFLELNGRKLTAGEAETVVVVVALAAGEMEREEFARWLRENTRGLEEDGGGD